MEPWWKTAVIYQIYPRSFLDSDGDGIGDLGGIIAKLDYLQWLGVDGIWLSPIFPSPMADFGYDVADYCDVDPVFGDLATFDTLLSQAHDRGLKVLLDWVPNHSSSAHPWFLDSISSASSEKRDYYLWRDPATDGGPPNNWMSPWNGGSAWSLDEDSGQYYLHCFLPEQPDLNWSNPELRAQMAESLRFWLDRGVDGFRMDVIHLIGKDPDLPDDPPDLAALSHVPLNDRPETHHYLRELRAVLDGYPGQRMAVGEIYLLEPDRVFTYVNDAELHLGFNFELLSTAWRPESWAAALERNDNELGAGWWPTMVLNNHDNPRLRTRAGGSEGRARIAAAILLCARGTPFLFAGEELGLLDGVVPADQAVDPGGRDGCRCPIPWESGPGHGWASERPWLPFPPEADERSAAAQRDDPGSMLAWYRCLLALRRSSAALRLGSLSILEAPDGVIAFERRYDDERVEIWANFSSAAVKLDLPGSLLASSTAASDLGSIAAESVMIVSR